MSIASKFTPGALYTFRLGSTEVLVRMVIAVSDDDFCGECIVLTSRDVRSIGGAVYPLPEDQT